MTGPKPTTIVIRGKDETGAAFSNVKKELGTLSQSARKSADGLGKAFDGVRSKLGPALGNAAKEGLGKLRESVARSAKVLQTDLGTALQSTQSAAKGVNTDLNSIAATADKVTPSVEKLSAVADGQLAKALRNVSKEAAGTKTPMQALTGVARGLATDGLGHLATIALNVLAPGLGTIANIALKTLAPALSAVAGVAGKILVAALKDVGIVILRIVGPPIQKLAGATLNGLRSAMIAVGKAATTLAKNVLVGTLKAAAVGVGVAVVTLARALDATLGKAIREIVAIIKVGAQPVFNALGRVISSTLQPAFKALQPAIKVVSTILNNTLIPVVRVLGTVAQSAARALNQWTGVSDAVAGALVRLGKEFTRITAVADKFQVVFRGVGKVANAVARGQFKEIGGILKETRTELDQVATSAQESFREWAKSVEEFNNRVKGLETETKSATGQLDLFGNKASESANDLNKVNTAVEKTHLSFDEYARAQRNVNSQLSLFGDEAKEAAPKLKQLADRIGETGTRAKGIISSGSSGIRNYIKGIGTSAKTSAGGVRGLGKAFAFLQSALPILSIGVAVDRLRALFFSAGQLNLQLSRLQAQSGISATTLDTFARAARQLGYDMGEVEGFMETFVERVQEAQEGTGEGAEVFRIFGINIRDAAGNLRETEDILFDYARTVSSISDQTEAAAFNTRLLGADGFRLGSAFAKIADTAGDVDEELEEMLDRTQSLNDSWTAFLGVTLDNARALGNVFTPIVKDLVDILTTLSRNVALWGQVVFGSAKGTEDAAKALLGYTDTVEKASGEIVTFKDRLVLTEEELDAVIKSTNEGAAADTKAAGATAKKTQQAGIYENVLARVTGQEDAYSEILKDRTALEIKSIKFLRERIKTYRELQNLSASQSNYILDLKNEELKIQQELANAEDQLAKERATNGKASEATLNSIKTLENDLYEVRKLTNQTITVTRTELSNSVTVAHDFGEEVEGAGENLKGAVTTTKELNQATKTLYEDQKTLEEERFSRYKTNAENIRVIDFTNHNKRIEEEAARHTARLGHIDLEKAAQINADIDSFTRRSNLIADEENKRTKAEDNVKAKIKEANDERDKTTGILDGIIKTLKTGVQGAISGLITGTKTWGEALSNIANSVLQSIINKFAELATSSIFSIFTGGKGGLGSLFGAGAAAAASKAAGAGAGAAAAGSGAAAGLGGIGKAIGGVASALAPLAVVAAPFAIGSLFRKGESDETKRRRERATNLDVDAIIEGANQATSLYVRKPRGGSHPNRREREARRKSLDENPERKIQIALSSSIFRNADKDAVRQILEENIDKFRFGGIVNARRGGRLVMAGEGGQNEAIVPLPNGRAIPVEIKGGAVGKTINITVNVEGGSDQSIESRIESALLQATQEGGILSNI